MSGAERPNVGSEYFIDPVSGFRYVRVLSSGLTSSGEIASIGVVDDALKVSQATLLAGEDQLNDVIHTEDGTGYELIAASQTAVAPGGGSGAVGDYLKTVTVIANTGTTVITDGAGAYFTIPAGATIGHVYEFGDYAKSAWKFTTAAGTEVKCSGRFS